MERKLQMAIVALQGIFDSNQYNIDSETKEFGYKFIAALKKNTSMKEINKT